MLKWGLIGGVLAALVSFGGCAAPSGETPAQGGCDWTIIVFVVVIFELMYFVMIRPQRKRQKEHQQMVQELKRGDRVITAGGIYGQIENLSDDSIVIKVESGALLRVARFAVAGKLTEVSTESTK